MCLVSKKSLVNITGYLGAVYEIVSSEEDGYCRKTRGREYCGIYKLAKGFLLLLIELAGQGHAELTTT